MRVPKPVPPTEPDVGEVSEGGAPRPGVRPSSFAPWLRTALWLKGANGVIELVLGFLLLFLSPEAMDRAIGWIAAHGCGQVPWEFIARHLEAAVDPLARGARTFATVYLLGHGVVKVALVVGLFLRQNWSYPVAIALLLGFIAYQCFRWLHTHSMLLAFLILLDGFIVGSLFHHSRILQGKRVSRKTNPCPPDAREETVPRCPTGDGAGFTSSNHPR
jgi:uncharacterized membrane protein